MTKQASARLQTAALLGAKAKLLELAVLIVLTASVVAIGLYSDMDGSLTLRLWIPLAVMATSAVCVFLAGPRVCGYIRNPRYVVVYLCTLIVMMAADLAVCVAFGEELREAAWLVLRNWILLVGSASTWNLLFTRLPVLSFRHSVVSRSKLASAKPLMMVCAVALQLVQMFISVLGASLMVAVALFLVRRVAILPVTHVIARLNFGPDAGKLASAKRTVEYFAFASLVDDEGIVEGADETEINIIGTLLLKLPIIGGRYMTSGFKQSLLSTVDVIVFVEQMLAFSSPTMIVDSRGAWAHIVYVWEMTKRIEGFSPANDPLYRDRLSCKRLVRSFATG